MRPDDTAIAFLWADTAADLILQGDAVEQRPPVGASGNVAEFADGWGTTMTLSDDEFAGMCRAYACDHIAADPRFSSLESSTRNRPALLEVYRNEIAPAGKRLTLAEAAVRMREHDVPFAHAHRLDELRHDAQIAHNRMFRDLEHPVAGHLRDARPAPRFSATPAEPGAPAPLVGEHTRTILEELGLGASIDGWLASGLVIQSPL